ncbi:ArnT family glycosyltransferase [Salinarimonas soli]|uniref:Glycosyltransferase family 39 protein n=1 Tax=Salinarimonas soli TaxID=1638099 RepID=A0A5B2VZY9_9HYPH|nr:glycosyltransferase family 39 protein [Salinarimonas soli]KAA2244010.1 glycosyltransferase family 39 protein [Salinarimonas soli]
MTSLTLADRSSVARLSHAVGLDRLFAFIETGHRRACAVLLLVSLACFLPGFVSLQPMDRDEPRFAQASKQMLETGDFVDIRFQDEARHKKPIGIYWLQSATVAAAEGLGVPEARATIAVYRLPSLVGALATVLLTYWAALAFAGRRVAFVSALLMATSVILMAEARLAKTDAVLAACSVGAMGGLARAYLQRELARLPAGTALGFWIAISLGILVKGPMIVMFAGFAAVVLSVRERSARWLLALRPGFGLLLTLALVAPWFVAILAKSGGAFFKASVGQDLVGKVGTAQVQHWAPPGTYLLVFFGTFWPGAILAAIAVPFAWINRREDAVAFTIAWVVPSWIVFEAVPTKLPHYVMPLYPAIAVLTAIAIARGFVGPHRPLARISTLLLPGIPLAAAIGLAVAAWTLDGTLPVAGTAVTLAAALVGLFAWRAFLRGEVWRTALVGAGASVLFVTGVLGLTQPVLRSLKLSPRLAEVSRGLDCPAPAIATVGYREPSLVFLTRTDLDMLDTGEDAAAFLGDGPCRLVFVERRFEDAFQAAAAGLPVRPALVTRVAGFNINGGRRLDIGAYMVRP